MLIWSWPRFKVAGRNLHRKTTSSSMLGETFFLSKYFVFEKGQTEWFGNSGDGDENNQHLWAENYWKSCLRAGANARFSGSCQSNNTNSQTDVADVWVRDELRLRWKYLPFNLSREVWKVGIELFHVASSKKPSGKFNKHRYVDGEEKGLEKTNINEPHAAWRRGWSNKRHFLQSRNFNFPFFFLSPRWSFSRLFFIFFRFGTIPPPTHLMFCRLSSGQLSCLFISSFISSEALLEKEKTNLSFFFYWQRIFHSFVVQFSIPKTENFIGCGKYALENLSVVERRH